MKRPLAYITAAWSDDEYEDTDLAARYCWAVYEAGFSPVCPTMYMPLFLNDAIPEEHKSAIDILNAGGQVRYNYSIENYSFDCRKGGCRETVK